MIACQVLWQQGLGEKKVTVLNLDINQEELFAVISDYFLKLKGCGRFQLLRSMSNSRQLVVISPKIAKSPKLLKAIVGTSKIYIRPIQQDIDMESSISESVSSTQVLICMYRIVIILLQKVNLHCQ